MFIYYDSGKFNEKCLICFRWASLCVEASGQPRAGHGAVTNRLSMQQYYCSEHVHDAEDWRRRLMQSMPL